MEDKVPDLLEFETLKTHDETNKNENVLRLEDPPVTDSDRSFNDDDKSSDKEEEISSDHSNDELLILHEPPEESKEVQDNTITDEVISQFAHNLVDPIVKEALEMQKAEMEEAIADEIKVDSSGDKKSEKSLSDDGFEYVKADDINSSSSTDQNNDLQQIIDSESFNKDNEEDSFLNDDLKLEDNSYDKTSFIKHAADDSFLTENLKLEESHHENLEFDKDTEDFNLNDIKFDDDKLCDKSDFNNDLDIDSFLNEESKLEYDSYSKNDQNQYTEDDSFLNEELEIENKSTDVFQTGPNTSEPFDTLTNLEDTVISRTLIDSSSLEKSNEENKDEEEYEFDIQGIINASNISQLEVEPIEKRSESNISQKCKEIVCWKDPILSLIVLSAIMLIELGLMCDYSIISLLAYSGLLLLCSSFIHKFAMKFNLLKKYGQSNCTISVSSNDIQICVDYILKWVEYLFNEIRSLTYVVSFTKNLKAFTFFWILTYIGQWFNLLSLIFMGTIMLFSLPIVYITYEDAIDQVINKLREQVKESINNLKSKFQRLTNRRA